MNKWLEILLGLVLVIAAILGAFYLPGNWKTSAWEFLKGGLVWLVILVGLLFLMLGISDLKE